MGHLEFPEDLFHPHLNVLGQMVLNHKETRQVLRLEKGIKNRNGIGPCLKAVTKIEGFNTFLLIPKTSAGLRDLFTYTRL